MANDFDSTLQAAMYKGQFEDGKMHGFGTFMNINPENG